MQFVRRAIIALMTALCLAVLLCPSDAAAQSSVQVKPTFKVFTVGDVAGASKNLLDGASCTAAAGSRTVTLILDQRFAKVRLPFWLTYVQADSVTVTATCSLDGSTYAGWLTRSCTSGTCTGYTMTDTLAAEATVNGTWEYDVTGCARAQFVFSCANAAAGDTLIAQAVGVF